MSTTYPKKITLFAALIIGGISLYVRCLSFPISNFDLSTYNLRWYQTIASQGIAHVLGTNFTNYSPPYTYLLALATLTKNYIPPIVALKLIPTFFDVAGASIVYKIVKIRYHQGYIPQLAAAIYFSAPSVMINSSFWGQADSIYTVFLLVCLYFILTARPFLSVIFFGIAFSIKAQSVFLLPFLAIMVIKNRIPLKNLALIPLIYCIAGIPVMLLGRPVLDTLLIYVSQSDSYRVLSVNAPNLYFFFSNDWYSSVTWTGISLSMIVIGYWVHSTSKANDRLFDQNNTILIALISTALTPFLLPKMHDRYFYPSDVLSIVFAFYNPGFWFVPVLYQVISTFATSRFLFNQDQMVVILAVFINSVTLAIILKAQNRRGLGLSPNPGFIGRTSWLYTISIPLIVFGLCLNLLHSPNFLRFEYHMPYFPPDPTTPSKAERYQRAIYVLDYLTKDRNEKFLAKFKLGDGNPMFLDADLKYLAGIKSFLETNSSISHLLLLGLFIMTLGAWIGDWHPLLRKAIARGGWLTVLLSMITGIIAASLLISNINMGGEMFPYLRSASILGSLFPLRFWIDGVLSIIFLAAGVGIILARGPSIMPAK